MMVVIAAVAGFSGRITSCNSDNTHGVVVNAVILFAQS